MGVWRGQGAHFPLNVWNILLNVGLLNYHRVLTTNGSEQWRRPGAEFGGTDNFFGGLKISE